MRPSNKRSRNKNNNNRRNQGGNIINRVFDSSGPEGKVRGTPQQIIEKYQTLARDAQLSGDRIAHESFLQFSEHYLRMLNEAQREIEERKEAQQKQQSQQNNNNQQNNNQQPRNTAANGTGDQPDVSGSNSNDLFPAQDETSDLVQTPESDAKAEKPAPKPRAKRTPKPKPTTDQNEQPAMPTFVTEPLKKPSAKKIEKSVETTPSADEKAS
ncbi:hypothetical protein GCM10008927_00620 [Amylibacter ulvae]|uniref:DUF4167 domain-containing protein n=1 Tax=Paramylibacter ulvae TaxID=1651968 RepID=A0ABQ3CTN7_9RHOB|nr:DUF4167 domain-containing protein [Amylibacter ulvae]GHA40369.1 hypothetical protein GCM10008927_00620 [Amylibacter ulvae]